MPSLLALCVVSALFLVLLGPLALVAAGRLPAPPVAWFTGAVIAGATGYQTGLFSDEDLSALKSAELAGPSVPQRRCAEIIGLLERAQVILDRRSPPRLVLSQEGWAQLPEEGRDVVLSCVQRSWPGAPSPQPEFRGN